jgi:hypothetical protein
MAKEKKVNLNEEKLQELERYAKDIKDLQLLNLNFLTEIGQLKTSTDSVRNNEMLIITNELLPDGKKKFSNAEQRQAEVERRLSENADYLNNLSLIKTTEHMVEKNKIDIAFEDRMFRYLELFLSTK